MSIKHTAYSSNILTNSTTAKTESHSLPLCSCPYDNQLMISWLSIIQTVIGTKELNIPSLCILRLWDQLPWLQWKWWWAAVTSTNTDDALWSWIFPLYELRDTSWAGRTTRGLCGRMLRQDLVLTSHCRLCRFKDNVCQTFRSEFESRVAQSADCFLFMYIISTFAVVSTPWIKENFADS